MMDRSVKHLVSPGAMKALVVFTFTLFMVLPALSAADSRKYKDMTDYDVYFLKYSNIYFGTDFDWRYFKAQAIVESNLRPHVQSQDGALGIMQIRPRTFREIVQKNPDIWADPKHPRWNIAAGIYYNRIMWDDLPDHLVVKDRLNFMFAAYNAGKFPIIKARQMARERGLDPGSWETVARVLSRARGAAAVVTVPYVKKINDVWLSLQ